MLRAKNLSWLRPISRSTEVQFSVTSWAKPAFKVILEAMDLLFVYIPEGVALQVEKSEAM